MHYYAFRDTGFDSLNQSLEARTIDDLLPLAKLVTKNVPRKKAALVAAISGALDDGALREFWNRLDTISQAAIAETAHHPEGRFDARQFQAKYGKPPERYRNGYHNRENNQPHTLLDIFLPHNRMPPDLQHRFLAFLPQPPAAEIQIVKALPEEVSPELPSWHPESKKGNKARLTVTATERAGMHDLMAVLRLIESGKLAVSKATQRATGAGVLAVLAVLRDGEFLSESLHEDDGNALRSFAWPLLVQAAGYAKSSGTKLALTKAGKAALAGPPHVAIKHVWKRWLKSTLLDEFNRIDTIKGQNRKKRRTLTPVPPRRAALEAILRQCTPGAWIELDEFFRFFQASGDEIAVAKNPWDLYISEPEYGSLGYDGFHSWELLEGRYVLCALWEYAATLGMVDVAHIPAPWARNDFRSNWGTDDLDYLSRYDGLMFFRINPLGAYCLGLTDTYEATPIASRPALRIQSNHEIVVADREHFEAGDALFLDRICKKSNESTWRLDQGKILAAIEGGFDPKEIAQFLSAKSADNLPDTVTHLLDDIRRRAALIAHAGTAEVFDVKDSATALLILHDSEAKALCFAAGENRLVVPAEKATAFRRALRKLGYVAAVGGGAN